MPGCALRYCKSSYKVTTGRDYSLFSFPPVNSLAREKWIKFVQEDRREEFWLPSIASRLCSKHFRDKDIYLGKTGRAVLKKGSIPCTTSEVVIRVHPEKKLLTKSSASIGSLVMNYGNKNGFTLYVFRDKKLIGCLHRTSNPDTSVAGSPSASRVASCPSTPKDVDEADLVESSDNELLENFTIHSGVKCACCNTVIVGNRYTCLQCLSVDLCSSCEAADFHPQHVVLRLPTPNLYEVVLPCLEPVKKALRIALPAAAATLPPIKSHDKDHTSDIEDKESSEDLSDDEDSDTPLTIVQTTTKRTKQGLKNTGTKRVKSDNSGKNKKRKIPKVGKGDEEATIERSDDLTAKYFLSNWVNEEHSSDDVGTQEEGSVPGQKFIEVVYPEELRTDERKEENTELRDAISHIEVKKEVEQGNTETMDTSQTEIKKEIKIEADLSDDEEICIQYGSHKP